MKLRRIYEMAILNRKVKWIIFQFPKFYHIVRKYQTRLVQSLTQKLVSINGNLTQMCLIKAFSVLKTKTEASVNGVVIFNEYFKTFWIQRNLVNPLSIIAV